MGCDFKSNNITVDITESGNDGVISSSQSNVKTYSLGQLPYAELVKVNKNNDEMIESIQVCHSNLNVIEIFSNNPYCFYRFNVNELSKTKVLQTFLLTEVFPKNKPECEQINSNSFFQTQEIKFYTKKISPSMTVQLNNNGKYEVNISGSIVSDCCLENTFSIFSYGTPPTTTTTLPFSLNNCMDSNPGQAFYLPEVLEINFLSPKEIGQDDRIEIQLKIKKGTYDLSDYSISAKDPYGDTRSIGGDSFTEEEKNNEEEFYTVSSNKAYVGSKYNSGDFTLYAVYVWDEKRNYIQYFQNYISRVPDLGCPVTQVLFDPNEIIFTITDN